MHADIQLQIDRRVEELTRQLEIKKGIAYTRVFRLNIINFTWEKILGSYSRYSKGFLFLPFSTISNRFRWEQYMDLNR